MKITSVVPWLVKVKGVYWGEYLFIEVGTDAGLTGWGEITTTTKAANRALVAIVRQLGDLLLGEDPAHIERLWHKVFRSYTYMGSRGAVCEALSGVDIALWDLRGKAVGEPVYRLLGGPVRDCVPLYTHPDQSRFGASGGLRQEIRAIVDSGHTALKFDPFPRSDVDGFNAQEYLDGKISRAGIRQAAEITAQVREVAGPDVELLIDAHGRFNVPTAIRCCRALEEAGDIDWFEEPVPVESYHALRQVRERVGAAISVGERLHTRWEFVPILESELADYIMPDVTWTGGISELKKIATLSEAYYVPISPHDASGPINVAAGAQVMITTPNCYRVETHRYDLSRYDPMIIEPLDVRQGNIHLSDAPGHGVELNRDYLETNRIEV